MTGGTGAGDFRQEGGPEGNSGRISFGQKDS